MYHFYIFCIQRLLERKPIEN